MKVFLLGSIFIGLLIVASCKKDSNENPYDPYNHPPDDTTAQALLPPTSFPGLYQQIFKSVCANSGCHDGTFEPDFRTIESSYNSLVFHAIIKNDASDPLTYRVSPGDMAHSILVRRLTIDLNGNSGIMPLAVDSGSDWNTKKTQYIENIKQWITDGAKDISGNAATSVNKVPQINGMMITAQNSSNPFPRDVAGVIQIPIGTNAVDIYFSVSDAETAAGLLAFSGSKFSLSRDDFSAANNIPGNIISPVNYTGYGNVSSSFQYKITIPDLLQYWQVTHTVFVSLTVSDNTNTVSLPGYYAIDHIKGYYSFEIN